MTPVSTWLWMVGFLVLPPTAGLLFGHVAYLWAGRLVYQGKFSLHDIAQFWGYIIGMTAMIWTAIEGAR